ncbi:Aliphatic sulfonates import ATP-binding protein SsuB [Streptomyces sp. YIM 130001]|uniref:ABC transporter ATP-binding protein n=1 Tax=Streptomyces sp. YIM 130001 TaxID=2259644 RepID=UPI000ECF3B74|nr:ABC transporter ATP-binding protein [Streptomyces sp. YIM 130001]RII13716.1 Aliphatic sulfonates import ATP-binding protein SsuB [Streptomyces sp. YIM 130001]
MSTAVQVSGLRRVFGDRAVLDGLDLTIGRGEFVALLGASGSGKTTLLRILGALDGADGGEVLVPEARTIVFQEPRLVPSKRVLANVTVGLPRGRAGHGSRALAEVGLERHADAWPATLSGGEAQRVALARALVREPELLLLDEPFAALDALTRLRMQDLVGELCRVHRPAVLLVTHDVEEAVRLADRVCVLRDGRLVTDERVGVPGPRDPGDPALAALRRRLLNDLGVQVAEPPGELAEPATASGATTPARTAEPAEPAEPAESAESAEPTESAEPVEPTRPVESGVI